MKDLDRSLDIGAKLLLLGWGLVAVKLYATIQYYQGRIDARVEMNNQLESILKILNKDMDKKKGEA